MVKHHKIPKRERARGLSAKPSHIMYLGLQPSTILRYNRSLLRFFSWVGPDLPSTLEDLDEAAGEYINHLFQDDCSLGYANDLVSGLKRFIPKTRRHLPIASGFARYWGRSIRRSRALPISSELLTSMAAIACLQCRHRLCAALMVGFLGLLRSGEIVTLQVRQIQFVGGGSQIIIFLPDSKGAKRSGQTEHVFIKDPVVVRFVAAVCKHLNPLDPLYPCTHASLGRDITNLGFRFGLQHRCLTPYCLRRGGATFNWLSHTSYDITQHQGRWADAKTARIYINEAMAAMGNVSIPEWGREIVQLCQSTLPSLLEEFCRQSSRGS